MIGKTMKDIFERNEGKHARQMDTDSGIVNEVRKKILEYKKSPTKEEIKAERRKTRFILVESIRILVTTMFLFTVKSWGGMFFPFVFLLAVTVLLSLLEYEADVE